MSSDQIDCISLCADGRHILPGLRWQGSERGQNMKSAVTLLIALPALALMLLPTDSCRSAEHGAVIAIDLETTPVPDVSAIDSVYVGGLPRIDATRTVTAGSYPARLRVPVVSLRPMSTIYGENVRQGHGDIRSMIRLLRYNWQKDLQFAGRPALQ